MRKKEKVYYSIMDDMNAYPDAVIYLVWGARGIGKTYGCMKECLIDNPKVFTYVKRTNDDLDFMCAGMKSGIDVDTELSPTKAINRDFHTNIEPMKLAKGVGGFFNITYDDKNRKHAHGKPYGYIASLHAGGNLRGFEASDSDWIIFDEFIPSDGDRFDRHEGDQLLNLYRTIQRDRAERGKPDVKLVCLSNANNINNPVFDTFQVTDIAARMNLDNEEFYYDEKRMILLHKCEMSELMEKSEKELAIYRAMAGTKWFDMAFSNKFSYNDFTNILNRSIRHMRPFIQLTYKNGDIFIYIGDNGTYHVCESRQKCPKYYDLRLENQQKLFFIEQGIYLRAACIEGKMTFSKYSFYDLIINYKKIFSL